MFAARKRKKAQRKNNKRSKQNSNDKSKIRNKKQKNKKVNKKLRVLLSCLSIVLICILLLSRYTNNTGLQMKISEKNKEIETLNEKKNQLNLKLEEIKESGWMEEQAKIRMNMRKANDEQVIYLDVK